MRARYKGWWESLEPAFGGYVRIAIGGEEEPVMFNTQRTAAAVTLVLFGVSFTNRGEQIQFAPAEGSSCTKSFEVHAEFVTSLVDISVEGMDVGDPKVEMSATWTREVRITDEIHAMRDGAPSELARSFDELTHELELELDVESPQLNHKESGETQSESGLDGSTVLFTWNEDSETYEKSFVDDEGDTDLLDRLTEDMDLRALLPEDEVDVGDEWEIDAQAFLDALTPGGDLGLELGMTEDLRGPELPIAGLDPRMAGSLEVVVGEPVSNSTVNAVFEELREDDDERLAVIAIRAELESSAERFELYDGWMHEYLTEDEVVVDLREANVLFELELSGTLIWDLDAGRARSLELGGDAIVTLNRSVVADTGGTEVAIEIEIEMEGELTISMSSE